MKLGSIAFSILAFAVFWLAYWRIPEDPPYKPALDALAAEGFSPILYVYGDTRSNTLAGFLETIRQENLAAKGQLGFILHPSNQGKFSQVGPATRNLPANPNAIIESGRYQLFNAEGTLLHAGSVQQDPWQLLEKIFPNHLIDRYFNAETFFWPGQKLSESPLAEDFPTVASGFHWIALSRPICVFCPSGRFVQTLERIRADSPDVAMDLLVFWELPADELSRFWAENRIRLKVHKASDHLMNLFRELDPEAYAYHPLDNTVLLVANGRIVSVHSNPDQPQLVRALADARRAHPNLKEAL